LRAIVSVRRFAYWPLFTALLAASGCGEGPPSVVNEPAEVAALRAAGKNPREIRAALRALDVKKALKGAPIPGRRAK
jgi:hypothetical protein